MDMRYLLFTCAATTHEQAQCLALIAASTCEEFTLTDCFHHRNIVTLVAGWIFVDHEEAQTMSILSMHDWTSAALNRLYVQDVTSEVLWSECKCEPFATEIADGRHDRL